MDLGALNPFPGGFEIFGILLVFLVVAALWSTVKIVSQGTNYHGRELRSLHADAAAGPAHTHPGYGAHRLSHEHEGAGARYPQPGRHHA